MDKIIVQKIADGWKVSRVKAAGIDKGTVVLATLCGGTIGKVLAATVAKQAAEMNMIETIEVEK